MLFDWDEEKNRRNIVKHGIDFRTVRPVLSSTEALVLRDGRRDYGEERLIRLCPLAGRIVHVTYTMRRGFIRIISARPADLRERQRYDDYRGT